MFKCGCKPGTYDDGWQEVKSPICRLAEIKAWEDAMSRAKENRMVRLPKSNIGPITLFVRINGKLVSVRSE